jgi:hypothetical protein
MPNLGDPAKFAPLVLIKEEGKGDYLEKMVKAKWLSAPTWLRMEDSEPWRQSAMEMYQAALQAVADGRECCEAHAVSVMVLWYYLTGWEAALDYITNRPPD